MVSLEEALALIAAGSPPGPAEEVALDDAGGRVLASPLVAAWDVPGFDGSAMDGFAVRAAETRGASAERPVRLRRAGPIFAGASDAVAAPGAAVEVMTGAAIPAGADAVLRAELARVEGESVLALAEVAPGAHIRRRGDDTRAGQPLLAAGARLGPLELGALASFGHVRVAVRRRPRVAVLPLGDELVAPEAARAGAVVESNSTVVAELARLAGAEVLRLPICPDDPAVIAARLAAALAAADVAVTLGGSAGSARDFARAVFERLGAEVRFWGVAIRPGRPAGHAVLGARQLFALPGNPAAAALAFDVLVRPALLARQGLAPGRARGLLVAALERHVTATTLVRAAARLRPTGLELAVPRQGAFQVTAALGTDAVVLAPPGAAPLPAGAEVDVVLLGAPAPAAATPAVGFVGPSGVGKTSLLERLLPWLAARGLRVAALKHDAHGFEMDREGKDTFRLRAAGAIAVGISSPAARAVLAFPGRSSTLAELLALLPPCDLVLVEGYRGEELPKIEVQRRGFPRHEGVAGVRAVAGDEGSTGLPRFDVADTAAIGAFVLSLLA